MKNWVRSFKGNVALSAEITRLRSLIALREDEIELLKEQVDGYRDSFQAIQLEYVARGAKAKAIKEMIGSDDGAQATTAR